MTTTIMPAFPGTFGDYADHAPELATCAARVRKPNRRQGAVPRALAALLVPFLLAAALASVLAPPASASVRAGCPWERVSDTRHYPSGETMTVTGCIRGIGGRRDGAQRWEWLAERASYPSGERSRAVIREVRRREAGQWVTVWEHAVKRAVYPSGETVTTVTRIANCEKTVTRHYAYPDGRTRDRTTVEPTC